MIVVALAVPPEITVRVPAEFRTTLDANAPDTKNAPLSFVPDINAPTPVPILVTRTPPEDCVTLVALPPEDTSNLPPLLMVVALAIPPEETI